MHKKSLSAFVLSMGLVAVGLSRAVATAAEPPPQYSPEDVAKTFADKPAASDAAPTADPSAQPAGECEKKGMVTGDDGICEPLKNERGFSLPTRASQSVHAAPARVLPSVRVATSEAAATVTRHRAPPSRDLMITFKLGSAELTDQGRANARAFAQALSMAQLSGARFELAGYTDASGDKDKNLALSTRRAEAVKAFLTSLGVDASRLETRGYGSQNLLSADHPEAAENRRVVASKLE